MNKTALETPSLQGVLVPANFEVANLWGHLIPFSFAEKFYAFHTETLDTAELSEAAYKVLKNQTASDSSALDELKAWSAEVTNRAVIPNEPKVKSITLNVNQVCNLACHYCAAGGDGTYGDPVKNISIQKTLPQLQFFLERLSENETFSVNLLGGEPLLYPEGVRLICEFLTEETKKRNLKLNLSITTNGTLFDENNLKILTDHKVSIVISMDGPEAMTDNHRPSKDGKSTFAKIEKCLELIRPVRHKISYLAMHGVFGRHNLDLLSAYKYYASVSVDEMEFTYDHEEPDSEINEKFIQALNEVAAFAFQQGGLSALAKIRFFGGLFKRLDAKQLRQHYCNSGQTYFMIDSRNQVFTCPWDVGHPELKVGEGTSLSLTKLQSYQGSLIEKNNCQTCWAKHLCGGGCMFIHKAKTGSKHKVDPEFCKRQRSLIFTGFSYYVQYRQ